MGTGPVRLQLDNTGPDGATPQVTISSSVPGAILHVEMGNKGVRCKEREQIPVCVAPVAAKQRLFMKIYVDRNLAPFTITATGKSSLKDLDLTNDTDRLIVPLSTTTPPPTGESTSPSSTP
jgi:hypothetical protein